MEIKTLREDYTILYAGEEGSVYTEPELITKLVNEGAFETRAKAFEHLRTYWETYGYAEVEASEKIYQALKQAYD